MAEHESQTIDHCPPPYRGHTKEQSTHGCTLGNTTIKNNHGITDILSITSKNNIRTITDLKTFQA